MAVVLKYSPTRFSQQNFEIAYLLEYGFKFKNQITVRVLILYQTTNVVELSYSVILNFIRLFL
jgi:hypothetical protein